MENSKTDRFIIPIAVILAGVIIAGAIFYSKKSPSSETAKNEPTKEQQANVAASPLDNAKINDEDHVMGNPDAPISIITFTDLECPYCKRFHYTMKQIMDEYGKTGKVKWILRSFPLEQLHSKARNEAIAAECAGDLGGNEKFWQYIDRIFEITPGNDGLDPDELPRSAEYVGIDKAGFENCLTSGKFNETIDENIKDAVNSGAQGTPYSVVIGPREKKAVIPGALPYSDVKKTIEDILK